MAADDLTLRADVGLHLGPFDLDVALQASADEVVAVVGPNGAGKTTLLRALAGLVPIDRGRITLGARAIDGLPPEERPVAVVFQDFRLFPHLSALDNVAYGLRAHGAGRTHARGDAAGWLDRVGLDRGHHGSRPARLSAGQAQRVALARALATAPALLLLDEPLSAVDAGAKGELRRLLREQLATVAAVRLVVTHDPVDAMALADRLVVVEHGRVTQEGPIVDVTTRPRSAWVAKLVGLNLFRGRVDGGHLVLPQGGELIVATDVRGPAFALVHPHAVAVHRGKPEGSARNAWPGQAVGVHLEGQRARVQVDGAPAIVAEVTPAAAAELRLAEGGPVWVSVKATEIDVYPG